MAVHRFKHLLEDDPTSLEHVEVSNNETNEEAMVSCSLFRMVPGDRREFVQAVYQLAALQTRQQLASIKPRRLEFSIN